MQYLNSSFSVRAPKETNGLICPCCVFGPKWGEHTPECQNTGLDRLYEGAIAVMETHAASDVEKWAGRWRKRKAKRAECPSGNIQPEKPQGKAKTPRTGR